MNTSITALFCCIDDFAKVFEDCERKQLISTHRKRLRSGKLSLSEMLIIMVLFHVSPFVTAHPLYKPLKLNNSFRANCSGMMPLSLLAAAIRIACS